MMVKAIYLKIIPVLLISFSANSQLHNITSHLRLDIPIDIPSFRVVVVVDRAEEFWSIRSRSIRLQIIELKNTVSMKKETIRNIELDLDNLAQDMSYETTVINKLEQINLNIQNIMKDRDILRSSVKNFANYLNQTVASDLNSWQSSARTWSENLKLEERNAFSNLLENLSEIEHEKILQINNLHLYLKYELDTSSPIGLNLLFDPITISLVNSEERIENIGKRRDTQNNSLEKLKSDITLLYSKINILTSKALALE